jgi:hypothetical protein
MVCGAEETQEIPALEYPAGSVVDVVFTVTGGKFSDGSTQKNVPVIKYEGSTPSRNGVGHLTAAQIPTDMIPDEGYDNGYWGDPEPTTSYNITGNITFAFSYTGTFDYDGTYTSYDGKWRPTTPQGPTQPRPTQPTQPRPTQPQPSTDNPSEGSESSSEDETEFTLVNGEAGDYGELITVGGENFWAYHIPSFDYIAVNDGTEPVSIAVYSDEVITNAEGKEVPAQQFANITLAPGATSEVIRMQDGCYVRLSDGATVRFTASEIPYIPESTETETDESTTEPATKATDSASESAEASETEPSVDPGRDKTLVLWPFILVISLLLAGLGVLIFFIVRLLKKSDDGDSEDDSEDSEDE